MQRPWPYPSHIAHLAAGRSLQNTLAGFARPLIGIRRVEFDVMLSADDVPVLIHDDTLEPPRTVAGASPPRLRNDRRPRAGTWFGPKYQGERVPTFEQAGSSVSSSGCGRERGIKRRLDSNANRRPRQSLCRAVA